MSATQQLASMLDELMGRSRNALDAQEKREITFDDPEVCKYFLVDYCPHELFTNTKADIGHCKKLHADHYKEAYKSSSSYGKLGYEKAFIDCIRALHNDMARKIGRNRQRLELTQPGGSVANMSRDVVEEKVSVLSEKLFALQAQAEHLGSEGNVEEAQRLIKIADDLAEERDRCRRSVDSVPGELKLMEVCGICGCFLIVGDSQHRLDEHLVGKQHLGFARIKETLDAHDKSYGRTYRDNRSPTPDRHHRGRGSEEYRIKGFRRSRSRSSSRSRDYRRRRDVDESRRRSSTDRRRSRERTRRHDLPDGRERWRGRDSERKWARDNGSRRSRH